MRVLIDPTYGWTSRPVAGGTAHIFRGVQGMDAVVDRLAALGPDASPEAIDQALNSQDSHGAAILELGGTVIAFTDAIRSCPVFHGGGAVSNAARHLAAQAGLTGIDPDAALEFAMMGYVTGDATLVPGLHQLRAGERLIARNGVAELGRYFTYRAAIREDRSDAEWMDALDGVLDRAMGRVIAQADGRPIFVPLSGGLDSRIILTKLHALGYDRLESFSYGPPGNYEAKAARRVAERLGVKWRMVPTLRQHYRDFFHSDDRRCYWAFADHLSVLPNPQDVVPLRRMLDDGTLPADAVLVNGQSGDFITGGHILPPLRQNEPGFATLFATAQAKHFSLWESLKTPANMKHMAARMARGLGIEPDAPLDRATMIDLYEWWEHDERQAKFVVGGQRIYDYLGLDWALPLWDLELVRLYREVPVRLKIDQRLYRMALERWDHRGLFKGFNPTIWRWPGASVALVGLAQLVGLAGRKRKQAFYKMARYVGHSRHFMAAYPWRTWSKVALDARNVLALDVRTWMTENDIPWPRDPA